MSLAFYPLFLPSLCSAGRVGKRVQIRDLFSAPLFAFLGAGSGPTVWDQGPLFPDPLTLHVPTRLPRRPCCSSPCPVEQRPQVTGQCLPNWEAGPPGGTSRLRGGWEGEEKGSETEDAADTWVKAGRWLEMAPLPSSYAPSTLLSTFALASAGSWQHESGRLREGRANRRLLLSEPSSSLPSGSLSRGRGFACFWREAEYTKAFQGQETVSVGDVCSLRHQPTSGPGQIVLWVWRIYPRVVFCLLCSSTWTKQNKKNAFHGWPHAPRVPCHLHWQQPLNDGNSRSWLFQQ